MDVHAGVRLQDFLESTRGQSEEGLVPELVEQVKLRHGESVRQKTLDLAQPVAAHGLDALVLRIALDVGPTRVSEDMTTEKSHLREVGDRVSYETRNMVTVPLKNVDALLSGGGNPNARPPPASLEKPLPAPPAPVAKPAPGGSFSIQ